VVASRYAAALSVHPVAFEAVGEVAGALLEQLDGDRPDLVVCFVSRQHLAAFTDIVSGLRAILEPDVLVATTALAVAGGAREVEDEPGLSVWAADWGGGHARGFMLDVARHRDREGHDGVRIDGWPRDIAAGSTLVLLADPFTVPVTDLLAQCNESLPGVHVIGGLASAATMAGGNRLALDDRVVREGAVGIVLPPELRVRTLVSQGCRPVGSPFTVTKAEGNVVLELGGQRAITRLEELVAFADERDRSLLADGLHVGVVVDEHKSEFGRGDFLVRAVLAADHRSGAITVGDDVTVGQVLQFHVRDADSADDDLTAALAGAHPVHAALLFTCTGRGRRLFGHADHDTVAIEDAFRPVPLAGAFCAGEIGPVGGRNFLHSFTATLALFE
jgi:small ligand-binding sensory domain FIST